MPSSFSERRSTAAKRFASISIIKKDAAERCLHYPVMQLNSDGLIVSILADHYKTNEVN